MAYALGNEKKKEREREREKKGKKEIVEKFVTTFYVHKSFMKRIQKREKEKRQKRQRSLLNLFILHDD